MLGFLLGLVFAWGLKNPLVWLIVSVLAITVGVGCLVWGTTQAMLLGEQRTSAQIAEASANIGLGAGIAVGGVVLLVVSLVRRRKWSDNMP